MIRREILLLALLSAVVGGSPLLAQEPCPSKPRLDCRRSDRSALFVKRVALGEYRIIWRWARGSATSLADLADPTLTTEYGACAYAGLEQSLAFAAPLIPGTGHWAPLPGDGYFYRDIVGDGPVRKLALRAGVQDSSRILLKAAGPVFLPPDPVLPITIQLINPDSGVCWESIFWRAQEQQAGKLRAVHRAVPRPNVILINTDDQRADTVGYMPTVLSEIAARGVTFNNAFVSNPICGPSRASLLTGNYNHTNGVLTNGPPSTGGALKFVGPDAETIAVWLQSAGYRTGHFGKYINGTFLYCDDVTCSVPPGWDEWTAFPLDDYFNYQLSETGPLVSYGGAEEDYSTDVLRVKALAFLDSHADEPVFVYFAPFAPHVSVAGGFFAVPAPRDEGSLNLPPWRPVSFMEPDASDKPAYVRNVPPLTPEQTFYHDLARLLALESLGAVDDAIAAILAKIEAQGKTQDTVVIFTSDNGFSDGEHRLFGKLCPYDECVRVPLIIRYPRVLGEVARARDEDAMVIDLAPTIAELGQVSPGRIPSVDGRSLAGVAQGSEAQWRDAVLLEQWMTTRYVGVRTPEWKYIVHNTGERELYDLVNDPLELMSVADALPAVAGELEARIVELGGTIP
jgi:arylsulfatase A-like enzyme